MRPPLPLLLAALLAVVGLAWDLGGYALLEPDEGRNAEVMRELATTGDWWMPRLNGLPYVDKPVLHFAAGAAALTVFGRTETAARLPSLVFTLGTVLLVGWFARRVYGPDAGWIAAAAVAATPFSMAYARTVIFDATLSFFITAALASFFLSVEAPSTSGDDRRWSLAGWTAMAFGVLTKGPVALAVPLLVTLPYATWRRRLGLILDPAGMLVLLVVVLPWVFAVSSEVPDFFRYVVFVETAQRIGTDALGRSEPWWYFLPILPTAALPWTIPVAAALPAGVRALRDRRIDHRTVFTVLWIAAPLLLFSLSRSKRPQYMLPLIPPIALLAGQLWRDRSAKLAGSALVAVGVVLLVLAPRIGDWVATRPDVARLVPGTARAVGLCVLVSGLAALLLARRGRWSVTALVTPVAALPIIAMPLMRAIGADRSSRSAAEVIAPVLTEGSEVVAVGVFPPSLPFYLDRTLTLATADARELTSNYLVRRHEDFRRTPGSTLRPVEWWREALVSCDRPRVFVTSPDANLVRRQLAEALPQLVETRKLVAYGPCGMGALASTD